MTTSAHQLTLFDNIKQNGLYFKPIHVNQSTFKGGLNAPVHNWFRLTPSFGPALVDYMLEVMGYQQGQTVLDPFAGAGTTQIQCKLRGIPSYGFEINPLLYFVGATSLNWDIDQNFLIAALKHIKKSYRDDEEYYLYAPIEKLPIPKIHNPFRWWREDVLRKMLCLKKTILNIEDKSIREFFLLSFICCLVPDLTNVTLGRLQLHFINRDNDNIDVLGSFTRKAITMINDIGKVCHRKKVISKTYCCDSTNLTDEIINAFRADYIITSPPYPNRYSYVWNTRPHLYFFDFFSTPKEASDLDKRTIGGTWGTATSCLQKGIIKPINEVVDKATKKVVSAIREKDNLMANYVMKYFNLLTSQIIQAEDILNRRGKVAYVVGNSWIKGIYVNTDEILQYIFLESGLFKFSRIERFRKRHSGKNLYESIVFASKD